MSTTNRISGTPIASVTGRSSSPKKVSSTSKSQVEELSSDVGVRTEIDTKQPEDYYDGGFGYSGDNPQEQEQPPYNETGITNVSEVVEATGVLEDMPVDTFQASRSVGIYETNMNMLEDEDLPSHNLKPFVS